MKYLLLAALALGACGASAQNYDGMARKTVQKAQKVGRQAERAGKSAGKEDCTLQMTQGDIQKLLRVGGVNIGGMLQNLDSSAGGESLKSLSVAMASLSGDVRRKIRRELKKLPQDVRKMPALYAIEDALRHPRKYLRKTESDITK